MTYFRNVFIKMQHIGLYAVSMAVLIFVLKWYEWKFLIIDTSLNLYAGLVAVSFTALGIWIAFQLTKTKVETVVVEKEIYLNLPFEIDETALKRLNLSSREYDVLQLLAKGHSNAEIADRLFLSLSTVKTHVSNLFVKMDVKSRAQAIEKAKRLKVTN